MDLDELVPGFSDLASLSQGQNDPTAQLEYLRGISDAEEVGTEQVAGVETTHYSGTVDLDAAYDRLPDDTRGELKQAIAQARKQFGHGAMPVDVWVDGDGLLRRMTMLVGVRRQLGRRLRHGDDDGDPRVRHRDASADPEGRRRHGRQRPAPRYPLASDPELEP